MWDMLHVERRTCKSYVQLQKIIAILGVNITFYFQRIHGQDQLFYFQFYLYIFYTNNRLRGSFKFNHINYYIYAILLLLFKVFFYHSCLFCIPNLVFLVFRIFFHYASKHKFNPILTNSSSLCSIAEASNTIVLRFFIIL